ncbi:NACHT and TPR domain protein [Talaromyces proteolyticus]|uniref:NACHT and TPR domain protein n=1 Tax=Talaromyces proteolyticus TaxID=1131652 RepID=A0AAD4KR51_9EURO|nr:NACHT and TPR domain protein [Talaromyces proteolyticus]KAH8695196.1 NACHT and TPR domain protein [Talaromyces proteolyticus]
MAIPKDQIPAIYEQAIKTYQEITDETLDVEFLAKVRNVNDLTNEIDKRNASFREFREKRGVIFNALQAALVPVELFGNLAAGGASMVFPPSSLVFGAVTYLMGAAKGVSASYDAIQDLMETLKDFTIRLKTYSRETISEDLSNKISEILVTLITIFALATKTVRRGRLLKFTRNILLGSNDAIQASMNKLDKLTRVEAGLVGAETLTESKRTGRVVDNMSVTINTTNSTVMETGLMVNQMSFKVNEMQEMMGTLMVSVNEVTQGTGEEREKSLQDTVKNILKPSKTDSAQDWYEKINKARVPGTGDWIRGEDIFKRWFDKDTPIIFVSGNPGAGKSYLSTNIITHLREQYPQDAQSASLISVGYFFFKDDNPDTRSFHQALRDLAFQISKNDSVYQKYLTTIEEYEKINSLESAWRLLFVEFFLKRKNVDSTVYILLDAVDEGFEEERKIFLGLAKELCDAPEKSHLQLAVVGRPHLSDQLSEGLEMEVPTIHVTTQKNSGDINQYIQSSIKKSVVLRRVSAKMRQEIIEKLSAGAEGMFLWVNLMLQELVKKRNESSMRKALEQAPKGLKEILRHVLSSFSISSSEEELEYLNELLLWVTCSQQPLTLDLVEAILKLKSPDGDGMIYLEGALRRQFASFFSLDREDTLTTAELQSMSTHVNPFDISDDEDNSRGADEEAFDDVENFTDFDSNKQTTTVTFCHASIGDFFRDETEGKVLAKDGHAPVGVNYYEAKAQVLKTYLRLFTDSEFAKKADDSGNIVIHAGRNWVHHLLTTHPSQTSLEDRKDIAKMLLKAFMFEDAILEWIGKRSWVSTKAGIQAVRQWWEDPEVAESFTTEEKNFIASTKDDPITTFKPLVMFCVKKWLCENIWGPVPLAAVVWAYQKLMQNNEVDSFDNFCPPAEEIIEAAEFGELEKNGLWYRRCAMALRQIGHHEVALTFFTKAVELEPDLWLPKAGMAVTYVMKGEWQKAVDLDEQCRESLIKSIEENPSTIDKLSLHTCLERMGNCYKELGEVDKSFESYKEAFENISYCDNCINALINHYSKTNAYEALVDLLKKLADTPVPEKDYSRLTQSLWDNPDDDTELFINTVDASLATNNLDFMVDAWRTAARAARRASKTVTAAILDMSLAQIYSELIQDQAKAVKRWEAIMNTYALSKDESRMGVLKVVASYRLARQFLRDAIEAGLGTPQAEEAAAKLERLVKQVKTDDNSVLWSIACARSLALGVYYRLSGREAEAKTLFMPSIKRGIHILSDDDPENDIDGLYDLMNALMAAGDIKNTVAIAYRIGFYGNAEDAPEEKAFTCDGPCRAQVTTLDNYYLCPVCFDTGFCHDCTKMLERDAMPLKRCNTKHVKDFIYIPSRMKDLKEGTMLVDGEEMDFEAWKDQVRKDWGF